MLSGWDCGSLQISRLLPSATNFYLEVAQKWAQSKSLRSSKRPTSWADPSSGRDEVQTLCLRNNRVAENFRNAKYEWFARVVFCCHDLDKFVPARDRRGLGHTITVHDRACRQVTDAASLSLKFCKQIVDGREGLGFVLKFQQPLVSD